MPRKFKKPCAVPGCPNLCEPGQQFCSNHKAVEEKKYNDYCRDKNHNKTYGRSWRNIRNRYHIDIHLDGLVYEGDYFTDGSDPRSDLNWLEKDEKVRAFMMTLTDVERRRLETKLDNPKISFEKMGKAEIVSRVAIFKTFTSIRSKYNAFFCC